MGLRVFFLEHSKNRFTSLGACVARLYRPSLLSIGYPSHHGPELPPEHQAVKIIFPVLLQLVPVGRGELMLARASRLLDQHLVLP